MLLSETERREGERRKEESRGGRKDGKKELIQVTDYTPSFWAEQGRVWCGKKLQTNPELFLKNLLHSYIQTMKF